MIVDAGVEEHSPVIHRPRRSNKYAGNVVKFARLLLLW